MIFCIKSSHIIPKSYPTPRVVLANLMYFIIMLAVIWSYPSGLVNENSSGIWQVSSQIILRHMIKKGTLMALLDIWGRDWKVKLGLGPWKRIKIHIPNPINTIQTEIHPSQKVTILLDPSESLKMGMRTDSNSPAVTPTCPAAHVLGTHC